MIFLDTANYWISLVSKTAALRVCQIIGNDNVSVNYVSSYESYYSRLSKACGTNSYSYVPVSVCIGTERLAVELEKGSRTLAFGTAEAYSIKGRRSVPSFVVSPLSMESPQVPNPSSQYLNTRSRWNLLDLNHTTIHVDDA